MTPVQEMFFYVEKPVITVKKTRLVDKDNRFIKEPEEGCKEETYKASYLAGLLLDLMDAKENGFFQIEINKEGKAGTLTPAEIFESLMEDLPQLKEGKKIIKASVKFNTWGFSNDLAPSAFRPAIIKIEAVDPTPAQTDYIKSYKAQMEASLVDEPEDIAI